MTNGWQTVPLADVLKQDMNYVTELEPIIYPKLSVKLYGKGAILDAPTDGANVRMQRHQFAKPGQIILSEIWAKKGAIGIVPKEGEGALVTSHFFLFDIIETKILREFIGLLLKRNYFAEALDAHARGTTGYAAVRPKQFLSLEIPLPPLDEQRRIVERVGALVTRIAKAQSLREGADEETEQLFINTISDLPIAEKDWSTVGSLLSSQKGSIHSGPFGSDLTHDQFVESGVAAIGTRDVQVNRFSMTRGWFVTPERFESLKQYQIHPNDVLVTIIGGSIGRFCVVPDDVPLAFTTKHIIAMKFDPALVIPTFASYLLNYHRRCRETMFSQTAGSAQPSLNASKVKAIHFPKLSLGEQRRIVAYLDSVQARLASLRELSPLRGRNCAIGGRCCRVF